MNGRAIVRIVRALVMLALALGVGAAAAPPSSASSGAAPAEPLAASGTVEADSVRITAQVGGRIQNLAVDEGDEVKSGQLIAELDRALLEAQLHNAQAGVAAAQAQLAQLKAGARTEDIHKSETALALAQVARDGARVAWEDAQAARANPQALNLQLATARAQVAIAEQKLVQATASQEAAQADADFWASTANLVSKTRQFCVPTPKGQNCQEVGPDSSAVQSVFYQWNLSSQKLAAAWDQMSVARAGIESAKANLAVLQAQADNPLAANSQVDAAYAQYVSAEAAVKESEATLALVRAGPTTEQVRVAELNVTLAQAAVDTIETQLALMALRSPLDGLVVARSAQQGEMAIPGQTLLTIANLEEVRLTLYIPETQVAAVKTGQKVAVHVDSYPERAFDGRVTYISPQAEFTPRNAQTQAERANLVFAVKVSIANPDHALKPGMPADAEFGEVAQ